MQAKRRTRMASAIGIGVMAAAMASADGKIEPVLEPNPEVTAILEKLGDNQAAMLPAATIAGDFNEEARKFRLDQTGPRGRDFCQKAAWAPDRQRALFCGANHGVPHRLNDVWEYDLPANTWYLLYAPDPNQGRGNVEAYKAVQEERTLKVEGPDGTVEEATFTQTKRGGPSILCHTYWQLSYDPQRRAMVWLTTSWPAWAYLPYERRWEPLMPAQPRPRRPASGSTKYIADMGGIVWHNAAQMRGFRLIPSDGNVVRNLAPNDGQYSGNDIPGAQAILSYDPQHRVLVALWGKKTYHYAVDENRWSLILDEPDDSEAAPRGHYGRAAFGYDPVGKVHLRYDVATPDSVWAYDVGKKAWARHRVEGPAGPTRNIIGYMDPARNVLVINDARDVWVYRYRKE